MLIQTVNPCDKACIADGFDKLSARSRQLRFFTPLNKLTDAQLTYLSEVDNINHVVITAFGSEHQTGIGLVRYIRDRQQPDTAELAITVTDKYQGRGAGSHLLDVAIAHAKSNDIRVLRGYVLPSNTPMIKLLERLHAQRVVEDDGSLRFDIHIQQQTPDF